MTAGARYVPKRCSTASSNEVADLRPADPDVDHSPPGDDLAVMGIGDEGAADDIAVPAGELEPARAPAQVRAHYDDLAIGNMLGGMGYFRASSRLWALMIR